MKNKKKIKVIMISEVYEVKSLKNYGGESS